MGQVPLTLVCCWRKSAIRELTPDTVIANNGTRRKIPLQEFEIVRLAVAYVKNTHAFERVKPCGLEGCVVIKLQLEDVLMLAQHREDSFSLDDSILA